MLVPCFILLIFTISCGGNGVTPPDINLDISNISGPTSMFYEGSATFSVTASGDSGIKYSWTVEPASAGTFGSPSAASTTFKPSDLDDSTSITIRVTISSNNTEPETLSISVTIATGQAVSWGGTGDDIVRDIAVDTDGLIYLTGTVGVSADFDPGPNLRQNDGDPCFLARYDLDCSYDWAVTWESDDAVAVEVSGDGRIAVGGSYIGAPDFDPGPGEFTQYAMQEGAYVSLFDEIGVFQWGYATPGRVWSEIINLQQYDYDNRYYNMDVAWDPIGNLFYLQRVVWITSWSGDPRYHTPPGSYEGDAANVIMWNSILDYQWSTGVASGYDGNRMAVDSLGQAYFAGIQNDATYIGHIDAEGHPLWHINGDRLSEYFDIAVDSNDRALVAGIIMAEGDYDCLLAVYTNDASRPVWLQWGSFSDDAATGVAPAHDGGILITGWFTGTADFDPGPDLEVVEMTAHHGYFLLKLSSTGDFEWVRTWGGTFGEWIYDPCIAVDDSGSIIITGSFDGTADLDPGPEADVHESAGGADVYIIRTGPDGLL